LGYKLETDFICDIFIVSKSPTQGNLPNRFQKKGTVTKFHD